MGDEDLRLSLDFYDLILQIQVQTRHLDTLFSLDASFYKYLNVQHMR